MSRVEGRGRSEWGRDRGSGGRPAVGAIVQAMITSVKPQLGLFVELPLPSKEFEGLVHLSEVSWDIQQFVKRVRGQPDDRDKIAAELSKYWVAGDTPYVRILKYKMDRGKTVADVSMLDVEQRGRSTRNVSPPRDLRGRSGYDEVRGNRQSKTEHEARRAVRDITESEEIRRKHSQNTRTGHRDVRLPELHSVHQAKIINAFHDGIFVSLPGYEVDGLVHHSQISRQLEMDNTLPKVERFKRIQEIVGDIDYDVWVKIVYVAKTEHLKCECSLKMVSQKNGRDLDPEHRMWIDYMRARRQKGAGYMHPEMKAEMDRVDRGITGHVEASPIDDNDSVTTKTRLEGDAGKHDLGRTLYPPQDLGPSRKRAYEERSASYWPDIQHSLQSPRKASRTSYDSFRSGQPSQPTNDVSAWPPHDNWDVGAPGPRQADDHPNHQGYHEDTYAQAMAVKTEPDLTASYKHQTEHKGPGNSVGSVSAALLSDPEMQAKFQDLVAAQVRAQLEALQGGRVGHQDDLNHNRQPYVHRER